MTCCPQPRACSNARYCHRLQGRQSHFGAEGPAPPWRRDYRHGWQSRTHQSAERIVLPGVGHFAATKYLDDTGLTPAIRAAIARGIPFLGICVGMQWLYAGSSEAPDQPGLAHFDAAFARFPEGREKVPHVGWNSIEVSGASRLFAGIALNEFVYFTHSYKAPVTADTVAVAEYIETFAAAVERGNVMGVQFHPEKSGETGLKILRNFSWGWRRADQTHHRLP